MTHPNTGTKAVVELSKITFNYAERRVKLIFGFPNQNAYPPCDILGWKMTENMERFIFL